MTRDDFKGKFRIVPVGTSSYIIQELKTFSIFGLNLWERWADKVHWTFEYKTTTTYLSLQMAKQDIEKMITERINQHDHEAKKEIYYP